MLNLGKCCIKLVGLTSVGLSFSVVRSAVVINKSWLSLLMSGKVLDEACWTKKKSVEFSLLDTGNSVYLHSPAEGFKKEMINKN